MIAAVIAVVIAVVIAAVIAVVIAAVIAVVIAAVIVVVIRLGLCWMPFSACHCRFLALPAAIPPLR